jgi:hypothetical protein
MGYLSSKYKEMSALIAERQNQQRYGLGGISLNDDEYASKTYAQIIRSQYDDYVNRFQPYEERMMDLAQSRELLDEQLSRITANINSSYANPQFSAGALTSQRYGVQQSADERAFSTKQRSMDKALATANAKNNTRLANADMQQNMITGGSSVRGLTTELQGG